MQGLMQAALGAFVLILLVSAGVGHLLGSDVLHPARRPLPPELIAEADRMLRALAPRAKISMSAQDDILLRGWKVRPAGANGDWVLLYHGISGKRVGMLGQAEFLLRHGFSQLMMDARAHGASKGAMATYGWRERQDTRAIIAIRERCGTKNLAAQETGYKQKSDDCDNSPRLKPGLLRLRSIATLR
jgi:hypothetical protein